MPDVGMEKAGVGSRRRGAPPLANPSVNVINDGLLSSGDTARLCAAGCS